MGVPWETKPVAGVAVAGGTAHTIEAKIPPRSYINKLVVIQTSGSEDGFVVELFNHRNAVDNSPASVSASDVDGNKIPLDCYAIGLPMPAVGPAVRYFSDDANGGVGKPFTSQDPDPVNRQGIRSGIVYIRITANGGGAKTFAYCIGGDAALGN